MVQILTALVDDSLHTVEIKDYRVKTAVIIVDEVMGGTQTQLQ